MPSLTPPVVMDPLEAAVLLTSLRYDGDPSRVWRKVYTKGEPPLAPAEGGEPWNEPVEIVGHEIAAPPDGVPLVSSVRFEYDDGRVLWLQLLRVRVGVRPPLWAERLYPFEGKPRDSIHGLEDVRLKGEFNDLTGKLWQALRLVREIDHRGRRRLEDEDDERIEHYRALVKKANALKRQYPSLSWEVIAQVHCGVSEDTLRSYCERFPE